MKSEIGEDAFRNWLRPMSLERVDDGHATIAAPTRFLRDWVATHYLDRLLSLWRTENERMTRVSIVVAMAQRHRNEGHRLDDAEEAEIIPLPPLPAEPAAVIDIADDKAQYLALDQRFVFENFVVGKPNEFAYAAARRVAEACAARPRCRSIRCSSTAASASARRI